MKEGVNETIFNATRTNNGFEYNNEKWQWIYQSNFIIYVYETATEKRPKWLSDKFCQSEQRFYHFLALKA